LTNAPTSRTTHVIRICGTNANRDVLQDFWADVERIDGAHYTTQIDGQWQGVQYKLKWRDDPNGDDYVADGTTIDGWARNVEQIKLCSADEPDQTNPTEWIPINVIKSFKTKASGQGSVIRHLNDDLTDAREVTVVRVVHYDTSIDDAAQAVFDADATVQAYVAQGPDYTRDDTTKDDSQCIEYQIITSLKSVSRAGYQGVVRKMQNQYLIDESDPSQDPPSDTGINPPWRLDPYQNIINVNFGSGGTFVAGVNADFSGFNQTLLCLRDLMLTKKSDQNWQSGGSFSGSNHNFDGRCGAYGNPGSDPSTGKKGTPTFVIGGGDIDYNTGPPTGFTYRSFIVTSTDNGRNWTKTYTTVHGLTAVLAYDKIKQLFYAQTLDVTQADRGIGSNWDWVIISSVDGKIWKEIDRIANGGSNPNYASPIIVNACDSIYKDATGHNCPGGVYGYNKSKRMVIAPYPDMFAYSSTGDTARNQIQILTFDKDGNRLSREIRSVPGLNKIFSVAYAGGIWMASGDDGVSKGLVAYSVDDGKTWANGYTRDNSYLQVILAAPKSDYPAGTLL
jgi:hypothetical protein